MSEEDRAECVRQYGHVYAVVGVARNTRGEVVDVYLNKLHYSLAASEADARSFYVSGFQFLAYDASAYQTNEDTISLIETIDSDDNVDTYLLTDEGGLNWAEKYVCNTGGYDCANPYCNQGHLESVQDLQILMADDLSQYSDFEPICPVYLTFTLSEEQLRFRRQLDNGEPLDVDQVREWMYKLQSAHLRHSYPRSLFEDWDWGLGIGNEDDVSEADGSACQHAPEEALNPASVNVITLRPAQKEAVEGLVRKQHEISTDASEGIMCPVCLKDVASGDETVIMPCSHSSHEECIVEWLAVQNTCPTCRYTLPAEVEEEFEEVEEVEEAVEILSQVDEIIS